MTELEHDDAPMGQSGDLRERVLAWCNDVLSRVRPEAEGPIYSAKAAYSQGMEDGARMALERVKKFVTEEATSTEVDTECDPRLVCHCGPHGFGHVRRTGVCPAYTEETTRG